MQKQAGFLSVNSRNTPRKLVALIFPRFEILDLFGPLQMFGMLPDHYEIKLIAEEAGPVRSNGQVHAHADLSLDDLAACDILLVPGGPGVREQVNNARLLAWIRALSDTAEFTLSVCTGSNLLATAELLDGKRATTNKAGFTSVTHPHENVLWERQARWVEDGQFMTSSGVSAGMDMALAVIAKLQGRAIAEDVALWAEYDWQDDSGYDPFAKRYGLV